MTPPEPTGRIECEDAAERIEIKLFLEGVFELYGYDFRDYAFSSMRRRLRHMIEKKGLESISELQYYVLRDERFMRSFLDEVSISVTAMFRNPSFYLAFRKKVVPLLLARPHLRIWHAGCSTGEEVYSMAILLKEEGLYERTKIYATDINDTLLKRAEKGIYPLSSMKSYTDNYIKAEGKKDFSDYYTAGDKNAVLSKKLGKNIVWAQHNLVTDSSFNEFDVIICRNVMIYFNKTLQDKVYSLFYGSLVPHGILGLGSAETIKFTEYETLYETLDSGARLYVKK